MTRTAKKITVKVKRGLIKVDVDLDYVASDDDEETPVVGSSPAGEYKGTKKVLGEKIEADLKFSTTTVEFSISGAVSLDCPNEAYSYSSGTISLTNIGSADDCAAKALSKYDAKLDSIKYDESKDKITVTVKDGIKVEVELEKVTDSQMLAPTEQHVDE